MAVFWLGVVGILLFYFLILIVGVWASFNMEGFTEVEMMNAGRRLGVIVGTLTLIGTWVGGGYISGTSEKMYSDGVLHVQVPIGYSLALLFGALIFIKPMRDANYITLLDPFQFSYGYKYGATLIFPALFSEFFWLASVLNALGTALMVILELDDYICVIVSATFAALYTVVGGLTSVTYTDVAQLILIVLGLVLSIPYALQSEYSQRELSVEEWRGHIDAIEVGSYLDDLLVLILGGIPWQGYFQRVFSIRSTSLALKMSWASMFGCTVMAIPALTIGAVAKKTNWTAVEGFERELSKEDQPIILPLVLRYLTPQWVAFVGLGAVSGAVMSSADSAIMASSALFTRNIYKHLLRPHASDKELMIILRITIIVVTLLATGIALTVKSIYYLSFMCSDLVYVILFPQLLLVLYFPHITNVYGSTVAYAFGMAFRILAGEPGLGMPVVTKYPLFDEVKQVQRFPFRTFLMIISTLLFFAVSGIAKYVFVTRNANRKYDFLNAFPLDEGVAMEQTKGTTAH